MSLILDALNRSDSDRTGSGDTPGIHSVHGGGTESREPSWRRWLWPALTLVFAAVALLTWWSSDNAPESPPVTVAEKARPVEAAPPAEPAVQPARAETYRPPQPQQQPQRRVAPRPSAERTQATPGFSDDVAALYSQMQASGVDPETISIAEPPVQQRAPAQPDSPAQTQSQALAELQAMAAAIDSGRSAPETLAAEQAAPAPAAQPQPNQQDTLDVDALVQAAQTELDNRQRGPAPVVQHEAPFIADLRQSQKDQIPSVFYSQHNWSSDPSKRSVILNGQELREGQQVKPGLRLVEILESSIVLNFNGTEFQLRSLNSWVNL